MLVREAIAQGRLPPSPFGEVDARADYRGWPLAEALSRIGSRDRGARLVGWTVGSVDLTGADLSDLWIEGCTFGNVTFDAARLALISDHENEFQDCTFRRTDFTRAGIGYGSRFVRCSFVESKFSGCAVSRPEFIGCRFVNARLTGVDFNGAAFVDTAFEGVLTRVWFHGVVRPRGMRRWFTRPTVNPMRNVDFGSAVIRDCVFMDACDLSDVRPPTDGKHHLFDNWRHRLRVVEGLIADDHDHDPELAALVAHRRARAEYGLGQDWWILNEDEQIEIYGDAGSTCLELLNSV